ncbi:MAG TPA: hypothetical protein VHB98_18915, partial [Chloroflexota bacterium]|nr:hypothetical protein [Chloroflexota bacterium]
MDNPVFVCVAPHGPLLIPLVSGPDGEKARASRAAMEELGRRMAATQPETIVVLETHSMVVDGAISLLDSAWVLGELGATHPGMPKPAHERHFALTFDIDRDLNAAIVTAARTAAVPVVRVRHFLPATPLTIEWGSLVPLWYLGATLTPAAKLVVASTNRHASQLPQAIYVDFGRALGAALA